jgi:hypothetical protein
MLPNLPPQKPHALAQLLDPIDTILDADPPAEAAAGELGEWPIEDINGRSKTFNLPPSENRLPPAIFPILRTFRWELATPSAKLAVSERMDTLSARPAL